MDEKREQGKDCSIPTGSAAAPSYSSETLRRIAKRYAKKLDPATFRTMVAGVPNGNKRVFPKEAVKKAFDGVKGKDSMESGFVYAPYVPLIVTPNIFSDEPFVPGNIRQQQMELF